jgi:hypothetical protein
MDKDELSAIVKQSLRDVPVFPTSTDPRTIADEFDRLLTALEDASVKALVAARMNVDVDAKVESYKEALTPEQYQLWEKHMLPLLRETEAKVKKALEADGPPNDE